MTPAAELAPVSDRCLGECMDQRVSFITLAVADLERTREFYVNGLGWTAEVYVPSEVLMIRVGDKLVLSLWSQQGFEAEVGPIRRGEGVVPITLAHNVATEAEVDAVLALAESLGAETTRGERRDWGGYTGYFADPDGFRWEIAMNPGEIGQLVLP
jgi:catechol 2,3-dioxygenase-like lactoylglutathione lyase family enzyme